MHNEIASSPLVEQMIMEMQAYNNVETFVRSILDIDWLFPKQWEIIKNFYDPKAGFNELIIVAGMRSGKTLLSSCMLAYELYKLLKLNNPCKHYGLPRGQEIYLVNVASSAEQAAETVWAHFEARIENSEWFMRQPCKRYHDKMIFPVGDGKIIVKRLHSNSASLAGKTIKAVICDELSRFKVSGSKLSAEMVWETLSRGTRTFKKEGIKISISSPLYVDDYHMQLYNQGQNIDSTLTYQLATWEMNPQITKEDLADEFQRNPEAAWRDYGAIPQSAYDVYFKEIDKVRQCVLPERNAPIVGYQLSRDIAPSRDFLYVLAGDPALRNDAFGMALGYMDHNTGIIEIVWAWGFKPDTMNDQREVDAFAIKSFITQVIETYPVSHYLTDTWNFPETIQAIRQMGVEVVQHVVKKEDYDVLKEACYTNRIHLPNNQILLKEIEQLEILYGRKIDHPRTGSKDIADAVAQIASFVRQAPAPADIPLMVFAEV